MSSTKFKPGNFPRRAAIPHDTADLMANAVKVTTHPNTRYEHYIPSFPMKFLQQAVVVGDALPLLLVALSMMRIQGKSEIALGPALWSEIGNPGPRMRSRWLKQIAKLPASLCTLEPRKGRPHLLRTGSDWPVRIQTKNETLVRRYG